MMRNVYVLAVLSEEDNVLLLQRNDQQNFGAGLYSLIGGKIEQGETALQAVKREVQEEVDLDISESEFTLMHVLHRKGIESEFIALVFHVDISDLMPKNNEPNKYKDMQFFDIDQLPSNMIPAHKQALESIKNAIIYSEHGW